MSSVTKYEPTHPGTRTLAEILVDEQAAFARRARTSMLANSDLRLAELAFASKEERQGAALLRVVLEAMDVVVWDAEVTIIRVILPNRAVEQLECWGADNIDFEPDNAA